MRVTSWLMKWWAAQTPLIRPHHHQENIFSLLGTMTTTSNPAVTAFAYCVDNLAQMYFAKDYSCLDYCTESTPSWTFYNSNISNSHMIMNMENSKECCNYHSEWEYNFIDPSIQPSAATRIWCFREERQYSSFAPHCLLTCKLNPIFGNPSHHNKDYCRNLELS